MKGSGAMRTRGGIGKLSEELIMVCSENRVNTEVMEKSGSWNANERMNW